MHSLEAIVEDPKEMPKVVCGVRDMDHDAPFDLVIRVDHKVEFVRKCVRVDVAGVLEDLDEDGGVPREDASVDTEARLLGDDDDIAIVEPQRANPLKPVIGCLERFRLDLGIDRRSVRVVEGLRGCTLGHFRGIEGGQDLESF